ncbi:MAG: hypothetical protein ACE37F_04890 [Nannocystaceae bacterium]|nr:hypothetical protein [bacterium]
MNALIAPLRRATIVVCFASAACGAEPSTPAAPREVVAPAAAGRAEPQEVDAFFEGLRGGLPAPKDLSQQNGMSIECGARGLVTLTLLKATADEVPLRAPSDLVALVPWMADADVCLRHIAVEAAVTYLDYDRDALVVPSMHDPEHVLYRDIVRTLRQRLDDEGVRYDATLFDKVLLSVELDDFERLVQGAWTQDVDHATFNFYRDVDIGADEVRVTRKRTSPDAKWPDHTTTTRIAKVSLHAKGHYVVYGKWDRESDASGYVGQMVIPSAFEYAFVPVREDVVWWKGGFATHWTKLRRRPSR